MRLILIVLVLGAMLGGCISRYETDSYTITIRDTTYREQVRNVPGEGSNGVVFPSSRIARVTRESISYDSTHERVYPNFMRFGALEFGGLITGASSNGFGSGLFGIYTLLDSNRIKSFVRSPENSIFKGWLFRIMPFEYRLRWFNDAPDWTIGWSAYESIVKDENTAHTLSSVGTNVYIRKRYWFRTIPPYLFASPFVGLSLYPSAYIHFGSELTFGSFGGFNLRGYLGLASGFTWPSAMSNGIRSANITTPYLGLGVSGADFINTVAETEHEWKDYPHSAIEFSVADFDLLDGLSTKYKNFFNGSLSLPISGIGLQLASAHFPLGIWDGKFWAGTTLFKLFALGYNQALLSILPLRFGYRQYLIAEDLTLEPFIEANYYPSSFVNIGGRLKLNTFRDMTVGLILGYATGSTGAFYPKVLTGQGSAIPGEIHSFYAGVSFGLKDRYNTPEHVAELQRAAAQWK